MGKRKNEAESRTPAFSLTQKIHKLSCNCGPTDTFLFVALSVTKFRTTSARAFHILALWISADSKQVLRQLVLHPLL